MYGIVPYIYVMSATPDNGPRTARLEARATKAQKTLLQQAAALTGRSLTDFLISSALEVATRTIREHEFLRLGGRDRKAFVRALLEAPEPGPRLREAAARYRKSVVS